MVEMTPTEHVLVYDFKDAARACRHYIEENDLGASRWRGGRVYDNYSHKLVAIVSYNGRVWTPESDWQKQQEIKLEEVKA